MSEPNGHMTGDAVETYAAADGCELAYRRHRAAPSSRSVALIYLHGIESHAGWFHDAASLLKEHGYDVFCLDRRGSGLNRENRGFTSGHASSFDSLIADVECFRRTLSADYKAVFLVGLSWGGKLALAASLSRPNICDGLVLITPGLRALADVGAATKLKIALSAFTRPRALIELPLTPEMFTPTPEHQEFIRTNPLRLKHATARFLFESWRMEKFIDRHMPANRLPIQAFLAGRDRIIDNAGVLKVLKRGRQETLDVLTYDDQAHAIQLDAPRRLADDINRWLEKQLVVKRLREGSVGPPRAT